MPKTTNFLSFKIPYSTIFPAFFMKFFRKKQGKCRKKSQKFDFSINLYHRNSILPRLKIHGCTPKTIKILSFEIPYSTIFLYFSKKIFLKKS